MDRERILSKLDDLESYLRELREITPTGFEEYLASNEKRRACERLLQIAVEAALDVSGQLVAGFRLGLPADQDDVVDKLAGARVLSPSMVRTLKRMRGFRNILVHEYGRVDDRIVFDLLSTGPKDLHDFKTEALQALRDHSPPSEK